MRLLRFVLVAAIASGCSVLADVDDGLTGSHVTYYPRCRVDADCTVGSPIFSFDTYDPACNQHSCDNGNCNPNPKSVFLPDDNTGDCLHPVCVNGSKTHVPDDSDTPSYGDLCAPAQCHEGFVSNGSAPDGTPCLSDHGACQDGQCILNEPADAGADD
jgi:hypothetical protein